MSGANPIPIALLVCDSLYQEPGGKQALIGLFNRISAAQFPATHPRMVIFVSLTEVLPRTRCRLDIVHSESEAPVFNAPAPVLDEGGPTLIHDIAFQLDGVRFPEPGRYFIRFFANDHPIVMRPFDVVRSGSAPTQGGAMTNPATGSGGGGGR